MELKLNAEIFKKMPDGSIPDYNIIYDAVDDLFSAKKIADRESERSLYQYADASRNHDMVEDRIECVSVLPYDSKRFIKDPTARIEEYREREKEVPLLRKTYALSESELMESKSMVAGLICGIGDEVLRQIMVAHYICGADWKRISAVYGYKDRWAKDRHNDAIQMIREAVKSADNGGADEDGPSKSCTLAGDKEMIEIERMEIKWKYDEY